MRKILAISLFAVNIALFILFSVTQHFPIFALVIHNISILLLTIWALYSKNLLPFLKKHIFDIFLACSLFIIAFAIYLYKINVITPGVHLDEITVAKASELVFSSPEYVPFVDVNYGHPTPLLYLTGLSIEWFGRTLAAIRLPSIIFGALTVAAFYILLRLFFNKTVSFFSSLLIMFSYPLIIVSRMAFEITPSLFFQIITMISLYLVWKKNDLRYYTAVGLSLGAGLYTYVGFRTFALVILALSIFIAIKSTKNFRKGLQRIGMLTVVMCIVAIPLFSYSLTHLDQITERSKALSVFNQGLSTEEVAKELGGSVFRLTNLFLPTGTWDNRPNGDPDPRRNPSFTTFFDFATFLIFLIGIPFFFKRNKHFLLILLIISVSPILNDILSLERIPEGHYYGLGHPNTLRIAGIIPIIYFVIAFALNEIKPFLEGMGKGIYTTAIIFISLFIIIVNWSLYFNQTISGYNYKFNGAIVLNIVNLINKSQINEIYVSSDITEDGRFEYFINKDKKIHSFKADDFENVLAIIKANKVTILNPTKDNETAEKLADYVFVNYKDSVRMQVLNSPIGTTDAVVFIKAQ
ncbi:glycosyltransferase family 39 protein [Patescibacteria group bacterium]|nr:glycosyltransferase family 39 protein [Patescibacteria group bacterium]MBU4098241.1 glycosyltransferase family 39 protein [Patescibacteria group bacterium]